eukprot:CAMPEP_0183499610 /NCGR_PEP_ID=MMETSP0371-20130417/1834_1 /TAXON_ID=268820 /ORGANISM="Peridinium aciculiferum, Strain PAER-2" /LENGTH=48 /DNA_ID= /DNA_START= /DNA_END= /DNA_ORIENTATION=
MPRSNSAAHVRSAEEAAALCMVLLLRPHKAHEFLGVHRCTSTAEGRIG